MDQKFLKRLISECPLTDFSQNGNVTERELQLDKYLEQFTSFLYSNENQLIQHFWQEYNYNLNRCKKLVKKLIGVLKK